MKQFYASLLAFSFKKSGVFSALFLFGSYIAGAQTYYIRLSNETPTNITEGTGQGLVTINGNLMTVQASFSGLTGNTTASHIHAATAIAGVGNAGVATTVPTFPGFPTGVKTGSYLNTFDMTQASSYNPSYITANGGTTASAFTALKTAINAGKSYLNIHSDVYPTGEIRGFLTPCPEILVTITDAFALSHGTLPNTVYPAYGPASSLVLQAAVNGGTAPYTYQWSDGSAGTSLSVSPTTSTSYSVSVHDQNGCPGTASQTVNVMDVTSGKKGEKIEVCHMGSNSLSIAAPAVASHLHHGDLLGECGEGASDAKHRKNRATSEERLTVTPFSNPSSSHFDLRVSGKENTSLQILVYDLTGREVEKRSSVPNRQIIRLGSSYPSGTYLLQVRQGNLVQTVRLVKAE